MRHSVFINAMLMLNSVHLLQSVTHGSSVKIIQEEIWIAWTHWHPPVTLLQWRTSVFTHALLRLAGSEHANTHGEDETQEQRRRRRKLCSTLRGPGRHCLVSSSQRIMTGWQHLLPERKTDSDGWPGVFWEVCERVRCERAAFGDTKHMHSACVPRTRTLN